MKTKLRAAIIGCGDIAGKFDENAPKGTIRTHIKAYQSRADVEVVAVADIHLDRAQAFAKRWKISKAYAGTEELLKKAKPDILSICTPDPSHLETLKLALDYPVKAVWCEKPLATDAASARPLIVQAQAKSVPVAVNYMRRWMNSVNVLREELSAGKLGDILSVTGHYTKGLRHNGSHTLDLWRYWFGEPSSAAPLGSLPGGDTEDPSLSARLRFPGGVNAVLIGLGNPGYSLWETDIVGTKGRVRYRNGGYDMDRYDVQESPDAKGYACLSPVLHSSRTDLDSIMGKVLASLILASSSSSPLASDGESALKTIELCEALSRPTAAVRS